MAIKKVYFAAYLLFSNYFEEDCPEDAVAGMAVLAVSIVEWLSAFGIYCWYEISMRQIYSLDLVIVLPLFAILHGINIFLVRNMVASGFGDQLLGLPDRQLVFFKRWALCWIVFSFLFFLGSVAELYSAT